MADFFDDSSPSNYLNINKIAIYFRSKQCSGSPGAMFPSGYLSTSNLSQNGSLTETVHDTALAYFNIGTPDPTNQDVLDTLTLNSATDFTNLAKKSILDTYLAGI